MATKEEDNLCSPAAFPCWLPSIFILFYFNFQKEKLIIFNLGVLNKSLRERIEMNLR